MRNPFKAFRELKAEVKDLREALSLTRQALVAQNIKVNPSQLCDFYGPFKVATVSHIEHAVGLAEFRINERMDELGKKLGLVFVKPSEVKIPAHWESEDA